MHWLSQLLVLSYVSLLNLQNAFCLIDPVSILIGAGALGGALTGFGFFKDQTYCRLQECCNERNIPANIQKLSDLLEKNLFGQHIVKQQLLSALKAHFHEHSASRKPLVMSFHGTPGTGKNYVADMIAEAMYGKGVQSRFVHKYMGRLHFPLVEKVNEYNKMIKDDVVNAIRDCGRSLFIFDEVDKIPKGVFESLAALVDYNGLPDKLDSSKAMFIFIANVGGVKIADKLASMLKNGNIRENIKVSAFETILQSVAYNTEGGLNRAALIDRHVIDHYIPFLPLEKPHVGQCIKSEFEKWNRAPQESVIDSLLKDAITYDRTHGLFATSGCKTIEKKVASAAYETENTW